MSAAPSLNCRVSDDLRCLSTSSHLGTACASGGHPAPRSPAMSTHNINRRLLVSIRIDWMRDAAGRPRLLSGMRMVDILPPTGITPLRIAIITSREPPACHLRKQASKRQPSKVHRRCRRRHWHGPPDGAPPASGRGGLPEVTQRPAPRPGHPPTRGSENAEHPPPPGNFRGGHAGNEPASVILKCRSSLRPRNGTIERASSDRRAPAAAGGAPGQTQAARWEVAHRAARRPHATRRSASHGRDAARAGRPGPLPAQPECRDAGTGRRPRHRGRSRVGRGDRGAAPRPSRPAAAGDGGGRTRRGRARARAGCRRPPGRASGHVGGLGGRFPRGTRTRGVSAGQAPPGQPWARQPHPPGSRGRQPDT
ncbi:hypothetical protein UG55_105710 [Frankia sp. EI5c]|nr:hypothetical protein UG55_105710 [Frankia sp. EI5c]